MVVIGHGRLRALLGEIFVAAGCSAAEAGRVADNLVEANLTGHDSHGVIRTARYAYWLTEGTLHPDREVAVVMDSGAMMVLDGQFGMGQTIGPQAVRRGIERCAEHGVSVVALRNSGHLGRIGAWAEMAAAAGLVSMHFVNVAGSVLVAPFGGVERRMSTNPVTIGVPVAGGAPVILDFATSSVAEGKVLVAAKGGKALPEGSLIGPDGVPSNDPFLLYGDSDPAVTPDRRSGPGALRAMGEHKGSGLALMCELLAGALTGSGCTGPHISHIHNGMLSVYLSVERLDVERGFAAEIDRYLAYFKSARPAAGTDEVLLPGEPERRSRVIRERDGIPLAEDAWKAIADTARRLGVPVPDVS